MDQPVNTVISAAVYLEWPKWVQIQNWILTCLTIVIRCSFCFRSCVRWQYNCMRPCMIVGVCTERWGSWKKMANDWFECQIVVSTKVFVTFPSGSSDLCGTLQPAAVITVCPDVHCLLMSQIKLRPQLLAACIYSSHFILTFKETCSSCLTPSERLRWRKVKFIGEKPRKNTSGCRFTVW